MGCFFVGQQIFAHDAGEGAGSSQFKQFGLANHLLSPEACHKILSDLIDRHPHSSLASLSDRQRELITKVVMPVVGRRLIMSGLETPRPCRVEENCVVFTNFGDLSKDVRFLFVPGYALPEISSSPHEITLKIYEDYDFLYDDVRMSNLIRRLFEGHNLHPHLYSSRAVKERGQLGEPDFILKGVQVEADKAVQGQLDRFAQVAATESGSFNRFLFVAPTGTGKTEVLKRVLMRRLLEADRRLHLVLADQNSLVAQLQADAEDLKRSLQGRNEAGGEFKILRWGDEYGRQSIEELLELVEASDVPIILLTTTQSFKASMLGDPEQVESRTSLMAGALATLVYDEAHHAGAEGIVPVLQDLVSQSNNRMFFYGTTATPLHRETDIADLFGNQAFWAYEDRAEDFLKDGSDGLFRSVDSVVSQLASAIKAGDLSSFDRVHLLRATSFLRNTESETEFFVALGSAIGAERGRHQINPLYRQRVARGLRPLFHKHSRGFVAAANINEAEAMTEELRAVVPERRFEVLHSQLQNADLILSDFRQGKIDFLVVVGMLDEGVNIPDMTLYVDLNRNIAPRQFLQRLGRVLRLYEGKEGVEVVSFMEIDERRLRDMILVASQLLNPDHRRVFEHENEFETVAGGYPSVAASADDAGTEAEMDPFLSALDQLPLTEAEYRAWLEKFEKELQLFWGSDAKTSPIGVARELNTFALNISLEEGRVRAPRGRDSEGRLRRQVRQYMEEEAFLSELNAAGRAALKLIQDRGRGGVGVALLANQYIEELLEAGDPIILPPRSRLPSALRNQIALKYKESRFLENASEDLLLLLQEEGYLDGAGKPMDSLALAEARSFNRLIQRVNPEIAYSAISEFFRESAAASRSSITAVLADVEFKSHLNDNALQALKSFRNSQKLSDRTVDGFILWLSVTLQREPNIEMSELASRYRNTEVYRYVEHLRLKYAYPGSGGVYDQLLEILGEDFMDSFYEALWQIGAFASDWNRYAKNHPIERLPFIRLPDKHNYFLVTRIKKRFILSREELATLSPDAKLYYELSILEADTVSDPVTRIRRYMETLEKHGHPPAFPGSASLITSYQAIRSNKNDELESLPQFEAFDAQVREAKRAYDQDLAKRREEAKRREQEAELRRQERERLERINNFSEEQIVLTEQQKQELRTLVRTQPRRFQEVFETKGLFRAEGIDELLIEMMSYAPGPVGALLEQQYALEYFSAGPQEARWKALLEKLIKIDPDSQEFLGDEARDILGL